MAVQDNLTRPFMMGFQGLGIREIVFNGDPDPLNGGRFIDVEKYTGLDLPDLSEFTTDYGGMHGGYYSANFFRKRTVGVQGTIYGGSQSVDMFVNTIKDALSIQNATCKLWYRDGANVLRYMNAKVGGFVYDVDNTRNVNTCDYTITFIGADPRWYIDQALISNVGNRSIVIPNQGNIMTEFDIVVEQGTTMFRIETSAGPYIQINPVAAEATNVTWLYGADRTVVCNNVYRSYWITSKFRWPYLGMGDNTIDITISPTTRSWVLRDLKSGWI